MKRLHDILDLLKAVFFRWMDDQVAQMAAALAYYTAFSIAPILVIAIAIAGLVFGQDAVQGEIVNQLGDRIGQSGAKVIQEMIASSYRSSSSGIIASIIGLGTLLFGASRLFAQLQVSMNNIWNLEGPANAGIKNAIKDRFLSILMVLGTGFLLLVSLIINGTVSALITYFQKVLPGMEFIWQIANFIVSFGVTTVIFALIFQYVPHTKVAWKDVWIGAVVTAILFTLGQYLLGLYLTRGTVSSTYGAAGSFVVILLWLYYSAQILLLGAEFTQVYSRRYGSNIEGAEETREDAGEEEEGKPPEFFGEKPVPESER